MTSEFFEKKYKELNRRQREAVDAIYGPVMVVAGPGTGKTTVLTLRIANILLKTDAKPGEILALTFTENGARTMREKLRALIGDTSFLVNIFTFHGFANYIRGLYPENFTKIGERIPASDADKIEVLEDILSMRSFKELRVSTYGVTISKISARISDLKRELVTPQDLKNLLERNEHKERLDEFALLYDLYEKELEGRNLYDFDDAILELIRALKDYPEMRAEVRESFQFILADEHQDANGAQNEILRLFKNNKEADPPNIFVVGDDKQSIFRFQGASLDHFYNFADEFTGAKKIVLEDNYRSQRLILEGSHSLISKDGRVHQKLLANVVHEEKKIEIVEYSDYESELAETAKRIKKVIDEHAGSESMAVIARHNRTLHDLAPYLESVSVDHRIAGERSLFEDFEYIKLFTLLSALSDPYQGRLLSALYAGYFNIPVEEVLKAAGEAKRERRDATEIILKGESGKDIKTLIAKAKKTPVTEFLKEIRREMYENASGAAYEALRVVFDEARKLVVKKRSATLDDLVSHLRFLERHGLALLSGESPRGSRVELLSVHRAKGLEYDFVFIVDVTEKKFGASKRVDLLAIPGIGIEGELAEERRLLYVAITRARKHVYLSYALEDEKGNGSAPAALLMEIDPQFTEKTVVSVNSKPDLLKVPDKSDREKKEAFRQAFLSRSFSVSALNSFLSCPWKYFFRYVLLIPDAPEFHASLGTACHNALKHLHLAMKKGLVIKEGDLKELVSRFVHAEPFTSAELPLAIMKAEEYVIAYTRSFSPFLDSEKVYVEEKFSFGYRIVDGERSFEVPITGKIDLARERDGIASVFDFKTKKRMTRNAIMGKTKNDDGDEYRQLQFYKFLLESAKPDLSVTSGVLTFLNSEGEDVKSEVFTLTDSDKSDIEDIIKKTLVSIHDLAFWGSTCGDKDCEYCKMSNMLPR